jgi:hypothetical protein
VYAGRDGRATVTGLVPGSAYSYSVFSMDASGNTAAGVSVTVRGTVLTIASATVKGRTSLSGRLTDAQSGAALAGRTIILQSRKQGTTGWSDAGTVTTGADGSWAMGVVVKSATEYQVRYAGSGSHVGSVAGPVLVKK